MKVWNTLTTLYDYIYSKYLEWESTAYVSGEDYREQLFREMVRKDKFGEIAEMCRLRRVAFPYVPCAVVWPWTLVLAKLVAHT